MMPTNRQGDIDSPSIRIALIVSDDPLQI